MQSGTFEGETGDDPRVDAVLDPAFELSATVSRVASPARVLLTGSTGFLGAFLLQRLLEETRADIHCLVRAKSAEEGLERIEAALESYSLGSNGDWASRIVPVPGDLARPGLGLSPQAFDDLASCLDAIYHNGAMVNAVYPYSVHKPTNVLGTREVLRLASRLRVKPVHYVSTTGVALTAGPGTRSVVAESIDEEDDSLPADGYSQSKWVAERLVAAAGSRGLPVCIYRPSSITGHSRTGVSNTGDLFSRILRTCIELGTVPQLDASVPIDLVPVDYVSQALVHLSLREGSHGRLFHLVNPRPIEWSAFIDLIADLGFPLRPVPLDAWLTERNRTGDGLEAKALAALQVSSGAALDGSHLRAPRFECRNTLDGLLSTPISCPAVDASLLGAYFSYWIRSGFIPPSAPVAHRKQR
jgi:thioester reductase-like protein